METRDPLLSANLFSAGGTRFRAARNAIALLLAAALAWLVLAAYRQPDFILDLAAMRLC